MKKEVSVFVGSGEAVENQQNNLILIFGWKNQGLLSGVRFTIAPDMKSNLDEKGLTSTHTSSNSHVFVTLIGVVIGTIYDSSPEHPFFPMRRFPRIGTRHTRREIGSFATYLRLDVYR